ncbi:MAG: hypothetical protein M1833_003951 [Piccolia ochrophora]|nr:MAG: hypothetical protein M1833_003951 [Piccolia ochrophora]
MLSALPLLFFCASLANRHVVRAQEPLAPQTNTFNSTATLSPEQREKAGINDTIASNVEVALNFERTNWANGSVAQDDFYALPSNASEAPAGALLKVQINANTSAYTLPPNTALSRILFQTKDFNGTTIPASAYVLWPYTPRTQPDGYPVISWAHGTSGAFGDCAPSHIKNLWYQFTAPYTLVLQGYVVVAPDYAGLGVDKNTEGEPIVHQYLVNPSQANDLFYAVQAAQTAFSDLSKRFVVMGHSQGGGAAWAAAQRQAHEPVEGYLGTIAASPTVGIVDQGLGTIPGSEGYLALVARGLTSIFPEFQLREVLTDVGLQRLSLVSELQGCNSALSELFKGETFLQPDWQQSPYIKAHDDLARNGGRPIAGPLLVLQGDADLAVPERTVTKAVNATCEAYPDAQLEYVTYEGASHVPTMYASQRTWLDWIGDRFADVAVPAECRRSHVASAKPYDLYQKEHNWFISLATAPYEVV